MRRFESCHPSQFGLHKPNVIIKNQGRQRRGSGNNGYFHGQCASGPCARYCPRVAYPLAKAQVGRFSDGEINVEILENIRGRETFIVQSTCPPTSENLMELLVMVDAADAHRPRALPQ